MNTDTTAERFIQDTYHGLSSLFQMKFTFRLIFYFHHITVIYPDASLQTVLESFSWKMRIKETDILKKDETLLLLSLLLIKIECGIKLTQTQEIVPFEVE